MMRGTSARKSDNTKVSNGFSNREGSISLMKPSNENIVRSKGEQGSSSKGFQNNKNMQLSTSSTRGNPVIATKSSINTKPMEVPVKPNYQIPSQQQVSAGNYLDYRNPRQNPSGPAYQQPQILTRGVNSTILRDKTNSSMNSNDSYQMKSGNFQYEMGKSENKISTLQSKSSFTNDNSRRNEYEPAMNYKHSIGSDSQNSYLHNYNQTPNQVKNNPIPQISPKEANRDQVSRFTVTNDPRVNAISNDYKYSEKEKPFPPSSTKPISYSGGNPYSTPISTTPLQGRENFVSQIQHDIQPKSTYSYSNSIKSSYLAESSTKQNNYSEASNLLSNQEKQSSNTYSYSKGYPEYEERKSERDKPVQHKIIHSPSNSL